MNVWEMAMLFLSIASPQVFSMVISAGVLTITATVTLNNISDFLWRHRSGWTTGVPSTMSILETQEPTNLASGTEEPSISTNEPLPATPSSPDSYAQSILDQHNIHRANCSALPLTWSSDLAEIAAQIASSCIYAHNE
jgi:uncharacterized protein YkwD